MNTIEQIKAEIKRRKKELLEQAAELGTFESDRIGLYDDVELYDDLLAFITSLQQEQPDFDDIDPKHLVHSHYTKVRETKTGRVFWAEYSREAAEWYEAGTGKAYSISDVEIVNEQPEVDLEKEIEMVCAEIEEKNPEHRGIKPSGVAKIARHFYKLGLNARKEE